MSLFVLDTDILTLYYHGDQSVVRRVNSRPASELAISVMTVDEQLTGWYTLTRQARKPEQTARAYAQLGEAVVRLARWSILPYTEAAIARVANFKSLRLNVGLMDLRIAAIALENNAIVVTRNGRDFGRVPGLSIEDWSV
ncbi:type II toxin-antitoxin system VapC family toxin [Fimbriiglobus ruber]|uniref:type II toxin-antitoxin system VapC family toxin n=1 Tax=Fimbriiglobus ruber TaxID=1908690 RepID=UPI000B4ABE92|nr:type II toxin-antitoxin system VapC family toxin [Fimbriiglobus ruber]